MVNAIYWEPLKIVFGEHNLWFLVQVRHGLTPLGTQPLKSHNQLLPLRIEKPTLFRKTPFPLQLIKSDRIKNSIEIQSWSLFFPRYFLVPPPSAAVFFCDRTDFSVTEKLKMSDNTTQDIREMPRRCCASHMNLMATFYNHIFISNASFQVFFVTCHKKIDLSKYEPKCSEL